jgi:Mrp family chromosome partitioning ATPase/capsular polysaccharide biosynthesis protein
MSEEVDEVRYSSLTSERHAWRSRVVTRANRFKNQLLRRWWLLVLPALVGFGVQAIVGLFETPLYVSCGRMIVNLKLSIPEGSLYTEELNNFLGTQAALMQSAVVMQRAHDRAGEQLPIVEDDRVALKGLILPRTTIFVLQGTGRDQKYTQAFVQSCMEEYINLKREMRAQTSDTTLAGMTEEVLRLERELRRCDEELVAFSSSNSVVLLQEQGNIAANFLAGLNQRLAGLKSEFGLLQLLDLDQTLERQQETGVACLVPRAGIDGSVRPEAAALADGDYLRARQQVLVLKAEREELSHDLRPAHPRMVALGEEIGRRERLLSIFRQESARQLESRKESLRLQIINLEQEVKEGETRALEMSRRGAEYQRLKANTQRTQALYDRLLGTMQTLDVNKQISPESVTIMEKASLALANHPGSTRRLLLGGLAGMGLGVLLLGLLDRLDDRVGSLTELQELFREEVLGQVPREKLTLRKPAAGLLEPGDERYAFVEAYRNLRSSLMYLSGPGQRARTLLVTSSVPDEGKSVTSANLAITLAEAGARVLLVDADLRKGSFHERFGIGARAKGLSEALAGEVGNVQEKRPDHGEENGVMGSSGTAEGPGPVPVPGWVEWVQKTGVTTLFLLPRGEATHRASELFLSARAARFLEEASGRYDFVVLDTAPVMAADDVTSLAPRVDGVLFVVRAEHSSARVMRAALDLLYLRHVRVLGLVFNDVRRRNGDYYQYYGRNAD